MGYGQYTIARTRSEKDRGYPSNLAAKENAHRGYIKKAEQAPPDAVWSRKVGKSALECFDDDGWYRYILYGTEIVQATDTGRVILRTGGWHTPTTRRHMMRVLERLGIRAGVYGSKGHPEGRNVVRVVVGDGVCAVEAFDGVFVFPDDWPRADTSKLRTEA